MDTRQYVRKYCFYYKLRPWNSGSRISLPFAWVSGSGCVGSWSVWVADLWAEFPEKEEFAHQVLTLSALQHPLPVNHFLLLFHSWVSKMQFSSFKRRRHFVLAIYGKQLNKYTLYEWGYTLLQYEVSSMANTLTFLYNVDSTLSHTVRSCWFSWIWPSPWCTWTHLTIAAATLKLPFIKNFFCGGHIIRCFT